MLVSIAYWHLVSADLNFQYNSLQPRSGSLFAQECCRIPVWCVISTEFGLVPFFTALKLYKILQASPEQCCMLSKCIAAQRAESQSPTSSSSVATACDTILKRFVPVVKLACVRSICASGHLHHCSPHLAVVAEFCNGICGGAQTCKIQWTCLLHSLRLRH